MGFRLRVYLIVCIYFFIFMSDINNVGIKVDAGCAGIY